MTKFKQRWYIQIDYRPVSPIEAAPEEHYEVIVYASKKFVTQVLTINLHQLQT